MEKLIISKQLANEVKNYKASIAEEQFQLIYWADKIKYMK